MSPGAGLGYGAAMAPRARDYLERILTSRVYDVAVETPLEQAPALSLRAGNQILLKREDMQPVFSFKLRGAYNKMSALPKAALKRGVIAASAGNHAQGVALSAQRLGCRAQIVMPVTTPRIKVDAVAARGAEVLLVGDSYDEAYRHAKELERRRNLTFVHPYDDPDVIAGQGTIGMEILRQHPGPIHAIFVAVGGGGLIAGIAAYVKRLRPAVRVIGVQPVDSDAMSRSLKAGRRVTLPHVGLFADGVAVKRVGKETFRLARKYVDEMLRVDTDATCAAIKDAFEDTRSILEPAGALPIPGAKTLDLSDDEMAKLHVRHLVGGHAALARDELVYRFEFPERPGALLRFLSRMRTDWNISLFHYRNHGADYGRVLVGMQVPRAEMAEFRRFLETVGYPWIDESQNPAYRLFLG